jgi:hypothetical protein
VPTELCKQEASTLGVQDWEPRILEGLAIEGCEEVLGERKVRTSLHQTIPHPREVWTRGLQAGLTTILSGSPRHLPRVATEEVLPEVTLLKVDLTYLENPIKVLDQKDHVTRQKTIKFFKIQWSNHTEEEATWESKTFSIVTTQNMT